MQQAAVPPAPESDGARVISGTAQRFSLAEGSPVLIAVQVCTSHETDGPKQEALLRVAATDQAHVAQLRAAHQSWWREFWDELEIDIGDDFLELFYYGSFYLMACSSRNNAFAPAISGVWTPTDHPHWGADYHMNYNHQAPWWGCYGGNHIGITEPYDTPVLQYMERGKYMADRYLGKKGIFYCVGIGPLGLLLVLGEGPPQVGRRRLRQALLRRTEKQRLLGRRQHGHALAQHVG